LTYPADEDAFPQKILELIGSVAREVQSIGSKLPDKCQWFDVQFLQTEE
jgi:hypothetical protein